MQPKTSRVVMRDKDLLVATGKELRMMTMSAVEGWEVSGDSVGRYKVGLNIVVQKLTVLNRRSYQNT